MLNSSQESIPPSTLFQAETIQAKRKRFFNRSAVCEPSTSWSDRTDSTSELKLVPSESEPNQEQLETTATPPLRAAPEKRVLGGEERSRGCGWIEWHSVKRKRKNGDVWECQQPWLHWEESGGKKRGASPRKRSRYIPKARLTEIERSVYELRRPIQDTLQLLEKK